MFKTRLVCRLDPEKEAEVCAGVEASERHYFFPHPPVTLLLTSVCVTFRHLLSQWWLILAADWHGDWTLTKKLIHSMTFLASTESRIRVIPLGYGLFF